MQRNLSGHFPLWISHLPLYRETKFRAKAERIFLSEALSFNFVQDRDTIRIFLEL